LIKPKAQKVKMCKTELLSMHLKQELAPFLYSTFSVLHDRLQDPVAG